MSFLKGLFGPPNIEKIAAKKDVKGLIKALSYEKDYVVQKHAAEALGKMGAEAVEALIAVLKAGNSEAIPYAADALGNSGDVRAVEPLITVLKSGSRSDSVIWALGKLGDARAVEPLIALLKDEDKWVRRYAAKALGGLGDARAVGPLIKALKDEDDDVCENAADALGALNDRRALGPLIGSLHHKRERVRLSAADALTKLGDVAVTALIGVLHDKEANVRGYAVKALEKLGDPRAVEPLIVALKDEDSSVRWDAAKALGKLGDPRAVEPLIAALEDKDDYVRRYAAEALEQLGDAHAEAALAAYHQQSAEKQRKADEVNRQKLEVRNQFLEKVKALENSRNVQGLIALLREKELDKEFEHETIKALERLSSLAIEPLIQAHDDEAMMDRWLSVKGEIRPHELQNMVSNMAYDYSRKFRK